MKIRPLLLSLAMASLSSISHANQGSTINIDQQLPALISTYQHLHQTPELSRRETKTAAFVAKKLKALGFEVTENIAETGLVAILKNGQGPTVMLRADMDALPVEEETGLHYASKVSAISPITNKEVPVMHACGHDMHMTVVLGTAEQMALNQQQWRGTLMLVFQPAEEIGYGANAMLQAGIFERFAEPDYNLTMHVSAELPAGQIGYVKGYAMANVDSVDISVFGKGGHGAYPHKTKDPVVIAAEIVTRLQTIISREISPLESAVITVGSIHGGTKHNIIGNEVKLQLTVRTYSDQSRNFILKRIEEISQGVAKTAGMPDDLLPKMTIKDEYTPSVYNQPEYTQGLVNTLTATLGETNVIAVPPVMAGEDFARYGRTTSKIPSALLWLGAVNPEQYQQAQQTGQSLPALHSSKFAPDAGTTIKTGVTGMTSLAMDLLAASN
ncbi:amidohydrolase [Endozoicomonas sp. G2_1]|uniref:M20 metallopeptidase family protein n=1 Tax=Endozoicomonas sp. G2_1 TaxID=2821091 RepID=UPI001ADCE92D|nr:amidohydrolase [Endozoicomonas sp. G2_1]MBO9489347.1 amidohydrolase [Endozoicomonas sp. G2_1]